MAEERINRKLAAILAADVVGYSRLMAADEAGTLAALKRHREIVFDPAVAAHNGRIVKLIGDGTIVEFGSVVDAVNCALSVQRSNGALPDEASGQPKIVLRIGINLGDVIIEGDDIYGDGVNIAARLEPLAEPGGICVSSIVNESIGNRIDVRFQDGGDISVKNIDRPIRVWKWHPGATPLAAARSNAAKPEPNGATASIAVLPFTNMSGDPEQEYFSDGISEDIITDLSKIAGLTVIARNSSFTYKGRSVDVRTIGRELGVRSVLEGSIRRAGKRVRITAQLIDAATGGHLWADRYDRDLTDIFEVQDDVTHRIVDALKVTLSPAEKARLADERDVQHRCLRLRSSRPRIHAWQGQEPRDVRTGDKVLHEGDWNSIPTIRKPMQASALRTCSTIKTVGAMIPIARCRLPNNTREQAIEKDPNEPLARCVARVGRDLRKGPRSGQVRDRYRAVAEPEFALWRTTFSAPFAAIRDSRWRLSR